MKLIATALVLAGFVYGQGTGRAAEPAAPPKPEDELTPAAQSVVEELRATLPADSEAIAMLDHILSGSWLGPGEGWFRLSRAHSRFDWDAVRQRYDADGDGAVSAAEFGGDAQDYARLDRDGNAAVTEGDFDWSAHSLTPSAGSVLFFMADQDANGKVTAEEFARVFAMLDQDRQGFLALDDLRNAFAIPDQSRQNRPDRPSRSTLVLGLKQQEIGSLQPGPALNDPAPDFTLKSLQGGEVTLSQEIGEQPIVLVFGNFTCGPFRSQAGNIQKLYERYRDRAKFFLVYVREAHPSDGWWMLSNQRAGIDLPQPRSDDERVRVAANCQKHLNLDVPFLVDTIDDSVGATYSGMPNRLYLIDTEGRIAFKNARGPFGFHPRQLEQALVLLLNGEGK